MSHVGVHEAPCASEAVQFPGLPLSMGIRLYVCVTGLGKSSLPPFALSRYTSTPFILMSHPGLYIGLKYLISI